MEWTSYELRSGGETAGHRAGASVFGDDRSLWTWAFFCRGSQTAVPATTAAEALGVRSEKMARLEAVLFVADGALSVRKLVQAATLADVAEVRRLIEELNVFYDADGSPFRIERVATGYQLLTRPAFSPWLDKLHQRQNELKLSSPAMETLTIVAYRQPITRADIEAIRGVQSAEMLKQLMERGLVRICGEEDSLGRPYLYDTTKKFLELFGFRSLDDLPMAETLRRKPQTPAAETAPGAADASGESEAETETEPPEEATDPAA